MQIAIISYDLKNVRPGDNERVKAALDSYSNTATYIEGNNLLGPFREWVTLKMPDTTLLVVNHTGASCQAIASEVADIIQKNGALADKVFVAFISQHFLLNVSYPAVPSFLNPSRPIDPFRISQ